MISQRDRIVKLCSTDCIANREESQMSLSSHVEELKKKHESLSVAVETAQRSPGVPTAEITEMKKQKLRLKEEISRLSH